MPRFQLAELACAMRQLIFAIRRYHMYNSPISSVQFAEIICTIRRALVPLSPSSSAPFAELICAILRADLYHDEPAELIRVSSKGSTGMGWSRASGAAREIPSARWRGQVCARDGCAKTREEGLPPYSI